MDTDGHRIGPPPITRYEAMAADYVKRAKEISPVDRMIRNRKSELQERLKKRKLENYEYLAFAKARLDALSAKCQAEKEAEEKLAAAPNLGLF